MNTKKRPFGVTLLAILAVIAALVSFYHALQFLGILPFSLGPLDFFGVSLLGAFFAGIVGLIYFWVARSLWNLRPQGWLFAVSIAAISLIFAILAIIGQSSFQALLPAIVVYGLVLIYCLLPGVRSAFQTPAPAAPAPKPAADPVRQPPPPEMESPKADAGMTPEPAAAGVAASTTTAGAAAAAMATTGMLAAADEPDPEPPMAQPESMAAPPATEAESMPASPDVAAKSMAAPPDATMVTMAASRDVEEEPMAVEPALEAGPMPMEAEAHAAASPRKIRADEIEGIGPAYAATLAQAGIHTTEDLLEAGATPAGRDRLVQATGLSHVNLLRWINMADLMRVPGIGKEYSQLLEVAGVDTVKELRTRNPANLHKALQDASATGNLVRRPPHLSEVEAWVTEAGRLDPKVTY